MNALVENEMMLCNTVAQSKYMEIYSMGDLYAKKIHITVLKDISTIHNA